MQSDVDTMVLPSPNHIGVVVKDLYKTIEFLSSTCGLGPWKTLDFSQGKDDLLVGEPYRQKVAFAKLGSITLELIQHLEGPGIFTQFLENQGEGLEHIAFSVSNWGERVSKLKEQGCKMVLGGTYEGKHWCYFDTKPGGIMIEFMEGFDIPWEKATPYNL